MTVDCVGGLLLLRWFNKKKQIPQQLYSCLKFAFYDAFSFVSALIIQLLSQISMLFSEFVYADTFDKNANNLLNSDHGCQRSD